MEILVILISCLIGLFLGVSIGVQLVTKHLIINNRLTFVEAQWYYSIRNLIKIIKDEI